MYDNPSSNYVKGDGMKNKQNKKNPYINKMSLDQIADAEANYYYIQVGEEIAEYGNKTTFKKDKAHWLFTELLENMLAMVEEGNTEDRSIARYGLLHFRVIPLRIH